MAKTVLIVDDAAFMRMMLKDILTKANYEVVGEASNGQEAIEKYQELKPNFVTMDITMPIKDGIQAIKEIKKIDSNAKNYSLQCYGAASYGYRIDSGWCQGFYCKTIST